MSVGVDAQAQLAVQIGQLSGQVADLTQHVRRQSQIMRGHPASWVATVTNQATQPTQLSGLTDITSLTGPLGGMVWEIRRITFGLPIGAALTSGGNLVVYREGVEVARTTTVPNFLTFSGYEFIIQPNEDIQVAWWGATATGTVPQLVVDVSAVEYPQLARTEITP